MSNKTAVNPVVDMLESLGFEVLMCGGNCPIQIEANHREGFSIYFRARGSVASLDIYDCPLTGVWDYLPDDSELLWEGEYRSWEWPAAGWLTDQEVLYVFSQLWRDGKDYVEEGDRHEQSS